jgi:hypothetical protein
MGNIDNMSVRWRKKTCRRGAPPAEEAVYLLVGEDAFLRA